VRSPILQSHQKTPEVPNLAYRFRQASQIIALLVLALGVIVLSGWAFRVPTITYIRPTFVSMKVNTALCFLLLGAGLWLAHDDTRQRSRRILGLAVATIGGATLVEYVFHVSLGIDQLIFRDTRTPLLSAYPGRMAISTAICFLFLGLALASLGIKKAIALQRALVWGSFALSLAALCGYLYGVKPLYSFTSFSTMALHTSIGLLAACLAYFLARSDEGMVSIAVSNSSSAFLLRTLIPVIIGVPILIGWLMLAGERANLYDKPFAIALMVLGCIACLSGITLLIVRSMDRLEWEESRVEEAARESEERQTAILRSRESLLSTFVQNVPAGVAMLDLDMRYIQVSDRWCADYGLESSQILGRSHYEIFPDVPERWKEAHRRALAGETVRADEDYWDRKDDPRWVRWELRPWRKPGGIIGGILIFAEDITNRKKTEEALAGMTRKLIEAHEEERTWIARELHDDVNQKLALLAVDLDQGASQTSDAATTECLHRVKARIAEIAIDVQSLSHRLHSSKLDYLGLVSASGSFCKELSQKANVQVEFRHSDVPTTIAKEVSLSLFRVLQEALQNAIKHSGVRSFKVNLRGTSDGLELTITDDGRGFDVQEGFETEGLGLTSMRERLQIVHGRLEIKSKPGAGTTIFAHVPLSQPETVAMAG